MKIKLIAMLLFFSISVTNSYSQSLLSQVTKKVDIHLIQKLKDRYKGGLDITNAEEDGNYITISGTFKYQIKTYIGINGNTVKRNFKASIKKILDDVSVINLCYVFIEYGGPTSTDYKTCNCTNQNVTRGHKLYVE